MNLTGRGTSKISFHRKSWIVVLILIVASIDAAAQELILRIDPAKSAVRFTLGDVLHTVHGTFAAKQSALHFEPGSGKVSGDMVIDAKSGESGNSVRDRKMHKEILESDRYPDISFRLATFEGTAVEGKFSAKVRGMFSIHGVEREITVPADVDIEPDHWSANVHFTVPYQKWGMKNPSTLFLRVSDSVEIDVAAAGSVTRQGNSD